MASRSHLLAGFIAAMAITVAACGGTSSKGRTKVETPSLPPADPEAVRSFQAGLRALDLGGPEAYDKAITRLRDAVQRDPKLWEAWHALGASLFALGDDAAAAEAFGNAIRVNPAFAPALFGRAEAYRRAGERKKARADYRRALTQSPDRPAAYARAASLLREMAEFEDALEILRESLRMAGASAEVYVELGLVYLAQGRDELAELVLQKAVALDPKSPAIHNALALVAMERGRDQEAFERFDHASSLDPSFLDARFNVASILIDVGDYSRAKQELEVVVSKRRDDFAARIALGVALRGLGKHDQARTVWQDVVKDAPSRSAVRGDALYNLAILEMDFVMDERKAKVALDRFLQESSAQHPKRANAEERRKELGL